MTIEWIPRKDENVEAVVKHPGLSRQVRILAENIRDQPAGVHAHVVIGYGDPQNGRFDLIEDDTINLGKMRERNALAREAAAGLVAHHNGETEKERHIPVDPRSPQGKVFGGTVRTSLRDFCNDAWEQHIGHFVAAWTAGSAEPRPPRWLMKPWSLQDGSVILFGREGGGKSNIMLVWAVMVTHGIDTVFGEVVEQLPVLFVNLERPPEQVKDQIGNIAETMGLPRDTEIPLINARGHSLRDVAPAIKQFVDGHDKRCVVALDSISRAISGDLNANADANALVNLMNSFGCPWWGIAHEAKDPEKKRKERTIFGAGAFAWAADLTVALSFKDPTRFRKVITLQTGKVNNAPRSGRQGFALDFEEDRGLVAFTRVDDDETGTLGKTPYQTAHDRLTAYLAKHGRQTYQELTEALGVTERHIRETIKGDPAFGRSSSRPINIYLTERGVTGSPATSGSLPVVTSGSPLDPSDPGRSGIDGTPPKGGVSVSIVPVTEPEGDHSAADDTVDQGLPVDEERCWVCGEQNEPARFTDSGDMICRECDRSQND